MMRERVAVPFELKSVAESDPGAFDGYGAVFGNTDSYGDVIAKGAFKDTIREWQKTRGKMPPMLLQHGGGFGGGAMDAVPIGVWDSMTEDDTGLYVKGRLIAMDTERSKQVYGAMKAGALDGLSIGFQPKQVKLGTKEGEPARLLQKIDLWEVSVVTFPANGDARVSGVKSMPEFQSFKELEDWLRDVLALTQKDRKSFISNIKSLLRRDVDATDESAALLDAIEKAKAVLKGATSHVGNSGSR